jgi:hypothetical protein
MSLLCHIAQASASNTHGPAPCFAPATTPTASSFQSNPPNAWISDDSFYANPHQVPRAREPSVARAHSRFARMDDSEAQEDENGMQIEQDDMQNNTFSPLNSDSRRLIGKQPGELVRWCTIPPDIRTLMNFSIILRCI